MIGGIDQQAIVAKRLQNGRGLRRRFGRQFADRGLRLREFVVEKLRQRVVDSVGAGSACEHEKRENAERAEDAQTEAAREVLSGETRGVRRRHDSPSVAASIRIRQHRAAGPPSPAVGRRKRRPAARAIGEGRLAQG